MLFGEYTDKVNLGGTVLSFGLGLTGLDFVADIRDLTHNVTHWEWTWGHAGKTLLNVVGLVPVVGSVKNLRPIGRLLDRGGDAVQEVGKVGRGIDSLADAGTLVPKVRSASSDALGTIPRPSRVPGSSIAGSPTKNTLVDGLTGVTEQSSRVAGGIRSENMGVNLLGDELSAKAYRMRNGTGEVPQAFAYGEQLYLRRGSASLLSDTVHEGTHGLDYLRGFSGSAVQWEKRAYFYERQFQRASGGAVDFPTINEMLDHINRNY